MYVDDQLSSVSVDSALYGHGGSRWPRREVAASWLDSLMFESGCTRSLTTVFEPVAPSRSDSDVDRGLNRTRAIDPRRKGFIVRRADEKAVTEVESREVELSCGYVECLYTGFTLTAPTIEQLDVQAADLEQAAANVGIELQPLWGRQGDGWVGITSARADARSPDRRTLMRRFDQHRRRGDVEDEPVPTVAGVAPISGSGEGSGFLVIVGPQPMWRRSIRSTEAEHSMTRELRTSG